eukprot:scaffold7495_cov158-Amphora_coffeaeformis.AAC.6
MSGDLEGAPFRMTNGIKHTVLNTQQTLKVRNFCQVRHGMQFLPTASRRFIIKQTTKSVVRCLQRPFIQGQGQKRDATHISEAAIALDMLHCPQTPTLDLILAIIWPCFNNFRQIAELGSKKMLPLPAQYLILLRRSLVTRVRLQLAKSSVFSCHQSSTCVTFMYSNDYLWYVQI